MTGTATYVQWLEHASFQQVPFAQQRLRLSHIPRSAVPLGSYRAVTRIKSDSTPTKFPRNAWLFPLDRRVAFQRTVIIILNESLTPEAVATFPFFSSSRPSLWEQNDDRVYPPQRRRPPTWKLQHRGNGRPRQSRQSRRLPETSNPNYCFSFSGSS